MLNNNKISTKNIKIQHTTQRFDEEFTPPRLRLLGPSYNAWNSLLCSKLQQKCVYNAQMPLKHVSMSPESPKLLELTLFASNLDKNRRSYDFSQYFHYSFHKMLQI